MAALLSESHNQRRDTAQMQTNEVCVRKMRE